MIEKNKYECCGCTACATVCPTQAISMQPDDMGFMYPIVNKSMCIQCGLCDKACSFHKDYEVNSDLTKSEAFLVRHKDDEQVEKSQSGAAFYTLASYVIDKLCGVVYGASFRDDLSVAHSRATTIEQLETMRGSKYVQCDMAGVIPNIKRDLQKGKWVFFCGTPCQTAGIKGAIDSKLSEKLILADFICHGVPSPYIWKSNLRYIEKQTKGKVVKANFRDKLLKGWTWHIESYLVEKEDVIKFKYTTDKYTRLFYKDIAIRKNCTVCPYTNYRRLADITVSDFWGYEKIDKTFGEDNRGCSMIMCNTNKGLNLFESVKCLLRYTTAKLEDCVQPNLVEPSAENPKRDDFERDYVQYGYEYVLKKYGEFDIWSRAKNKLKRIINRIQNRP